MKKIYLTAIGLITSLSLFAQRSEQSLEQGWRFTKGEVSGAEKIDLMILVGKVLQFHMTGLYMVRSM